jgi:hypothetical protein
MFVLSTTFRYLVMMFLSSFTLVHVVKPKHGASHCRGRRDRHHLAYDSPVFPLQVQSMQCRYERLITLRDLPYTG